MIYWGGFRRRLVPLSILTGVMIGATLYEPDGYVAVARPVCAGFTPDGCSLEWRDVPTEDGFFVPQCVQFCPRLVQSPVPPPPPPPPVMRPAPPPPPAVVPPPPAPPPAQEQPADDQPAARGCEIEVFTEPNFEGQTAAVTEDEPMLADEWTAQISSARVLSGTWELYDEEDFGGEATRLTKGDYATLNSGWDNRVRSMMCVEPEQQ